MTMKPGKLWFSLPSPYVSHDPMLGRENACSPVFICRQAPLWLMLSATIERMTHRSSTHEATCGKSSLTSVPHWPCLLNFHGDLRRLPVLVRTSFGISKGSGLPLSWSRRGLGSKVSTCDGPPDMKRKMMRLARAGYCGGRTASGLGVAAAASSASKPARATMPKPLAKWPRAWRRVSGSFGMYWTGEVMARFPFQEQVVGSLPRSWGCRIKEIVVKKVLLQD